MAHVGVAQRGGSRAAQHRRGMHHDLVAGQGDQGGVAAGFRGDIGHRADLARIQPCQVSGQRCAICGRSSRAAQPQADEVLPVARDRLVDQLPYPLDCAGADRAVQVDADRARRLAQGRVFFEGRGGQCEPLDQLVAVAGEVREAHALHFRPREPSPPRLTGGDHDAAAADRAASAQLGHFRGQDVLVAVVGVYLEHVFLRPQHALHNGRGHRLAPAGDLLVAADHRRRDPLLVDPRRAKLCVRSGHDQVACQDHQHGVAQGRLRNIGHGVNAVELLAGEKVGQEVSVVVFGGAGGLVLMGRDHKLEDQLQPLLLVTALFQ